MINYKNHLILTKTPIREALTQLTILGIDAIIFVIDKIVLLTCHAGSVDSFHDV
jgi:hypothetical protein